MADIIREAPFGQLVRILTGNKFFKYPEETDCFKCPSSYKEKVAAHLSTIKEDELATSSRANSEIAVPDLEKVTTQQEERETVDLEKAETSSSRSSSESGNFNRTATLGLQRTQTVPYSADRVAIEAQLAVEKTKSTPIIPVKTADNVILVDWYTTDDPANPQNWYDHLQHNIISPANIRQGPRRKRPSSPSKSISTPSLSMQDQLSTSPANYWLWQSSESENSKRHLVLRFMSLDMVLDRYFGLRCPKFQCLGETFHISQL